MDIRGIKFTWKCMEEDCDNTEELSYYDLIECGTPLCPDHDVEMEMVENEDTADNFKQVVKMALDKYIEHIGVTKQSAIRDLITDIIHISNACKLNFTKIVSAAREVAKEEKQNEK